MLILCLVNDKTCCKKVDALFADEMSFLTGHDDAKTDDIRLKVARARSCS